METENFQPRIRRIVTEERPVLEAWDTDAFHLRYTADADIKDLATNFSTERAVTVELFKALSPEHWKRTGVWPDGREIDLAWLAEEALGHSLDHFAVLLDLHGEFERLQAPRWTS